MMTRRQRIISLLEERDYSPSELAQALGLRGRGSKKLVLDELRAIQKTLKREGKVLLIKPAECRKCGFRFKPEIKVPSRCPRCKSEWIEEPRFKIERRG
ncbi:transcriptional regulator [Thermococcus sp.]|uniref:transcriptional regulator n=1 Tax=Thermococcus sp. TaxID=35749 RepID=UPI002606F721|nr:transcriptional regulator [Thermococcus sp.]